MITTWKPNPTAPIWHSETKSKFFQDLVIKHTKQIGPSCVATTLSMLVNSMGYEATVEDFKAITNSQSPHTWCDALKNFGLQLAYCNVDLRRLDYYIDELISHDDLFLLSFYSGSPPYDPDVNGKLCTAHIVTLHKDTIYDTARHSSFGGVCLAKHYDRLDNPTKRVFRVVPLGHKRCI